MARGQPDFGMYAPKSVGASMSDMAELAVRLGSIVQYDRRGDVIHLDDFETGVMKWNLSGQALGYDGALDAIYPKNGARCLKLTSPNEADKNVAADMRTQFFGSYRIGQKVSFSLVGNAAYIENRLDIYTGSRKVEFRLRYNGLTEKLYYYNSAGAWVEIDSGIFLASYYFHYWDWKLVVDAETEKYVRAMLGAVEYDLSTISAKAADNTDDANIFSFLTVAPVDAVARSVYYDDYVLTQNEP